MFIENPPKILRKIYPTLEWSINTKENEIFITFDDGPTEGVTALALDLLKNYNAKATFFCLGKNIKKHPDLFKRIINEGHSIGNHTYNHLNGWNTKSFDYLKDIEKSEQQFKTKIFRPPYGKIKPSQLRSISKDFRIIMWTILSTDYKANLSPEKCAKIATSNWKPGNIIVFHDSEKAKKNMLVGLEAILNEAKVRGFKCSSI